MTMPNKKDAIVVVIVLLALVCDFASALYITQEDVTKLANDTFFVLCRDEGGRPVTWIGPKGPLGLKTRPRVQITSYGSALLFNHTVMEDSGVYTCSSGKEKKDFHLTVEPPLIFMDTSANQTGIEGGDVTLRCEVRGGKVTWSVEGGEITDKKFTIMGDGLLIKNVHRTDSNTYVCKGVQPGTGTVQDRKIKLRVLHKPSFPQPVFAKQEQAYGYINGTVNLTCVVISDPPPRFKWYKIHDAIQKTGRVFEVSTDVSILQLHVDRATFGNYKCVAENPYGKLEKHFSLDEGSKPLPPKYIELRGSNSDLLDLGIHGPGAKDTDIGMDTRGFNVQYRPEEEEEEEAAPAAAVWLERAFNISDDNSYPLRELQPNVKYEVRAATRNVAGLSDYTNISIFQTLPSPADSVHSNISINITTNLLILSTLFLIWIFHS